MSHIGPLVSDPGRVIGPKAFQTGVGLSLVWTSWCAFSLYRMLVCIFKHGEGQGGRGGSRQRRRVSLSSGQNKKKKKFYFLPGVLLCRKARLLPYLGIHSSSYPSCAVILCRLSFHSPPPPPFVARGVSRPFIEAFAPFGWRAAGWRCPLGSSLWVGCPGPSGSPTLRWSRTSRSQGLDQTCHARIVSSLLGHPPTPQRKKKVLWLFTKNKTKKNNSGRRLWNRKARMLTKKGHCHQDWFMVEKVI